MLRATTDAGGSFFAAATAPPVRMDDDGGLGPLVDTVFVIVGVCYGLQVLQPIPMTYLSEIAFPFDFCIKLTSSIALAALHALHALVDLLAGPGWHEDHPNTLYRHHRRWHGMIEAVAWATATTLLWMEHRRSQTPSLLVRVYWLFCWLHATIMLFGYQNVALLSLDSASAIALLIAASIYTLSAILGVSCFFTSTSITADLIELPAVHTPSAYLRSTALLFPPSSAYGTFTEQDLLKKTASMDGRAMGEHLLTRSMLSRSSQRGAPISVTIPTSTTSIWGKNQFVSYKIVVKTEEDRWSIRRQYSDFVALHEELPEEVRENCQLPGDDTARKYMSWKSRPNSMKSKLEKYLRQVLRHRAFEPYSSQALCDFLEMEYVDESLLRSIYSDNATVLTGDSLLAQH